MSSTVENWLTCPRNLIGVVTLNALTPYEQVPWNQIAGDSHPLRLLLSRGISVYFKFSRGLHFAVLRIPPIARDHVRAPMQDKFPSLVTIRPDHDVFLLRLVEDNIREIIATGDCVVEDFSLGGLKLSNASFEGSTENARDESRPGQQVDEVDFLKCFLVNKIAWSAQLTPLTPNSAWATYEDFAYHPRIGVKDLYIESLDLAMLQSEAIPRVEPKPSTSMGDRQWPPAIQVLYEVSVAFNTGAIGWEDRGEPTPSEKRYAAIIEWIEMNTSREVSRKKWKRTVKTIVPVDYNRSIHLKEARLPQLPEDLRVPRDHLSVAVYCAMTIAQSWLGRPKAEQGSKYELASLLLEVGFKDTAVVDLVSMVMGIAAPVEKTDVREFIRKAGEILAVRERTKRRVRLPQLSAKQGRSGLLSVGSSINDEHSQGDVGDDVGDFEVPVLTPRL